MTHLSTLSPLTTGRRAAAVAALGAGALALIAGCGGGTGHSAAPASPLTPHQAITLAADQTQDVNEIGATVSLDITGAVSETATGSIQVQLKPTLLVDENLTVVTEGQTVPMTVIVSAKAMYLKSPAFAALTGQTGKTWLKIPLSELSGPGGSSLSGLLQNVQNGDPLTQTKMLAASKNIRAAGTQVIDGVRTTHYVGTINVADALAALPANLRKQVAPLMKLVSGDIRFNAWIDAQHQVRKVTEVETVMGQTANVSMDITSINKPVHLVLPRPRQTLVPPASAFATGTSS
jgi:hypothetical protein